MRAIFRIAGAVLAGILGLGIVIGARAGAEERPGMLGISHVSVKVSDVDKSVAFYRDFLGFAEEYRLYARKAGDRKGTVPFSSDENRDSPQDGSLQMVVFKVNDDQCIQVDSRAEGRRGSLEPCRVSSG